ncbi:3208_t:CDS:2, partial [Cetraspora pellucida]
MNIQTSRQTKNSLYALVLEQNPLHHFTILKKIKDQHINLKDETAVLNAKEQQLLELDEKLDNQLSKRINKRSYEKLSIKVTEKKCSNKYEAVDRSLPKDEVIRRSLPEDEFVGRRLPKNVPNIYPSKKHKSSVLITITMGTNIQ